MCSSTSWAQGGSNHQLHSQDFGFISKEVVDNVVFDGMGQFKPGTPQFHQAKPEQLLS